MTGAALAARLRRIAGELVDLAGELERRPAKARKAPAPRPDAAEIDSRQDLWAVYRLLFMERYGTVATSEGFAVAHGIRPDEFGRWRSRSAKKFIPSGSSTDRRARAELEREIVELGSVPARPRPTGNLRDSQSFPAHPH